MLKLYWQPTGAFLLLATSGAVNAEVVINEVLGSTTGSDTEYVELFNSGAAPVDISGWSVELWDSDDGTSFGLADGGSPYFVPTGTVLEAGQFFLFANDLAQTAFAVSADVTIQANAIENSSYTIVLRDAGDNVVNTIFVTDGGINDVANIAGNLITADLSIGPDGSNLPAGFTRSPDGSNTLVLLEFSPVPAPSGTPTASNTAPPSAAMPATIMEIQGAGHTSPLNGVEVITSGVVTAVDTNGFYVQDPLGDGDIATSDALFVFTGGAPTVSVGQTVELTGEVSEFFPGGEATGNLSTTQMAFPQISVTGTADLPAPVILGLAGRQAPTENIDDDAFTSFDPATDGIDYFESLEAMRVTAPSPLAISPTNRFLEIFTVADSGASATGLSSRQTLNISPNDFNPEKIQIDEDSGLLPGFDFPFVDSGAVLSDVTGVIGYDFGNFQIHPTTAFTVTESSISPETTTISGSDSRLTVATYNVLNLETNDADGDTDVANGRFEAIAAHIVNNLNAPDIIGLQEIQDNDGSVESDITAADVTLQALVDAIAAAGGPSYAFQDTVGIVPGSVGGQPGGNIRAAFLYNPARVELAGDATPLTDPADQAVNPDNPFFGSRISLAADFIFNGETVTVVNNHFSSKGGSAPIFGVEQPFEARQEDATVNGSLDERQAQATAVNAFVSNILANDPQANIVVLGDMNEFEFISPVRDILGENLTNTSDALDPNERYSFIFQGNSQQIDHILLSDSLVEGSEVDIVHVNTEFAETDQRASDHDPLVVGLNLGAAAIQGDLDNDGDIDRHDLRLFVRALGSREGGRRYNPDADFDNNGRVNLSDLRQFLALLRS